MTPISTESSQADLHGDMRFTELLAEFIRAIRDVRVMERRHAQMGQFFSPAVVETLVTSQPEKLLQPRTQDATVLFCDLRGFSRTVEQAREGLYTLLCRVSDALSVMTRNIMKFEGVIADFQGDAAMGFWGWPTFSPEDPLSACRAALAMLSEFREADGQQEHALAGFKVGIGICHGTAIAGKIGTNEQAKIGVFGPVVNLASRLESFTKQCGVPILIDEATARRVRKHLRKEAQCRRIARVRPVGIDSSVLVSELLPRTGELQGDAESHLLNYEKALDAFTEGRWEEARDWLDRVPDDDGAKQFLTRFLVSHNWQPPEDWVGVIDLHTK
jgi:adenylate cyclase